MKKIKWYTGLFCSLCLFMGTIGCEPMDEVHKQYLEEYNYSGKIQNLRVYIGYERVDLAWDNPKEQRSKNILIEYQEGEELIQKEYPNMIDSVTIDNLKSGSGYEFTVYTLDAKRNKSVPVFITALPVSEDFVNRLVAPTCILAKQKDEFGLTWNNLSSLNMTFGGKLTYTVTGSDGTSFNGEYIEKVKEVNKDGKITYKNISSYSILFPQMKKGVTYTIEYTTDVYPLQSKKITMDLVQVKGTATIKIV